MHDRLSAAPLTIKEYHDWNRLSRQGPRCVHVQVQAVLRHVGQQGERVVALHAAVAVPRCVQHASPILHDSDTKNAALIKFNACVYTRITNTMADFQCNKHAPSATRPTTHGSRTMEV